MTRKTPDAPLWSRRHFLRATAAAGVAGAVGAALVGLGKAPREIAGSLVGASHALGHRLREGADFPPPAETRRVPVAIVGGGVAGLSAGWKLDGSGMRDFVVLELEADAGGNSRAGENAVTAYPWGAHYLPFPPPTARAVRELLEELGVIAGRDGDGEPVYDERYVCFAPQERLFAWGRWQEGVFPRTGMAAEEEAAVARFRERMRGLRRWRDARGRPAFALPMELSTDDAGILALDRISMREWLERERFDSPRLRWYVEYCCRDDYGCTLETTSAWAALHYFCARGVEDPEVLTWPDGNGFLVRRLAERLVGRVATGALAFRIERDADGRARVDYWDARGGRAVRLEASHVICALPRFVARRIVLGHSVPGDEEFTYAPWAVANVTVDRPPPGACWDNVILESESLGYIVATHQHLAMKPGPSVLTWYRPFAREDPREARAAMLARRWEEWRDLVLADLSRVHPSIADGVRRIDVMLWGHGMVRPTPGFVTGRARRAAAQAFGPIRFAHSDLSGLSLFEEAQYRGVKAAEEVLSAMGVSFRSSL